MTQGEEKELERQIRAALVGPSRPLRGDQIEGLLEIVRRRSVGEIPQWALGVLSAGLLAIVLIALASRTALANGYTTANLLQIALLIPAVNLILSPLAAFVIVRKTA